MKQWKMNLNVLLMSLVLLVAAIISVFTANDILSFVIWNYVIAVASFTITLIMLKKNKMRKIEQEQYKIVIDEVVSGMFSNIEIIKNGKDIEELDFKIQQEIIIEAATAIRLEMCQFRFNWITEKGTVK